MHLRWDAVRLARSAALTSPPPVINPSGRTTPSNALRPTANTETPTGVTQLNHIRLTEERCMLTSYAGFNGSTSASATLRRFTFSRWSASLSIVLKYLA